MGTQLTLARVLTAIPHLGLLAGHLVAGSPDQIEAMAKGSDIDPHPDAVAYAKSQNAPVINVDDVMQAKADAEAEIASLQEKAQRAPEGAKPGILGRIQQLREFLSSPL